jgi:phosphoribosylglycinamide formyltransferase-1|tara:strand:- start:310 stop:885 length:576 start_codon:yes stop_codon:yes gene_type:complete
VKLAVLGSTNGTDLVPVVGAERSGSLSASVDVIISNNESSGILKKARHYGIENYFICHKNKKRGVFDFEMSQILENKKIDLILLIGFMRILSPGFVDRWGGKIINVHPSLLPKYAGGMNNDVHESVLAAGDKETGCTIHLVTKEVDGGPILLQKSCPVFENDSVESLKERVQELEGKAFIEVINNWSNYGY